MPKKFDHSKGDRLLYQVAGRCISAWADIEASLFDLCHLALRTSHEVAAVVYYRTPTVDARLSLTDELLATLLPQREKRNGGHDHHSIKEWKTVRKRIKDCLAIRRSIAHHPLSEKYIQEEYDDNSLIIVNGFSKPYYELLRPNSADEILDLDKLETHLRELADIKESLGRFFLTANSAQHDVLTPTKVWRGENRTNLPR